MRAAISEIPLEMQVGAIETRGVEWGDQLVRHLDLPPGTDFTPFLVGLPGDRCECPHWGYLTSGEAFYWPAGHTAWTDEGVTLVEFSLAAELRPVLQHIGKKVAAAS